MKDTLNTDELAARAREALTQPSDAATALALTATPEDFPRDSYGLALWLDRAFRATPQSDGTAIPASYVASDTMREAGEQFAENAKNLPGNPCPIAGCTAHAKPGQLMCWPHWRRVPRSLNRAVFDTFANLRADPAAYRQAREAAIDAVNTKEAEERA